MNFNFKMASWAERIVFFSERFDQKSGPNQGISLG
jgi:hypothetical protein